MLSMRVVFWILSFLVFGACIREAGAQLQEEWEIPIADLPENVTYPKGKFSIFADFDHAKKGSVAIYIINDTDKVIGLPSQDGDVYLKQEVKIDGKWVRSQPHVYSWCGNSYMPAPRISPGHFMIQPDLFQGWAPNAKPRENDTLKELPVRYRFYTDEYFDVFSNQGKMPVSLDLINIAEYDSMAFNFGPVEKLAVVATGEVKVKSIDHIRSRGHAISGLSRFPGNPIAQAALRKVIKDLYSQFEEIQQGGEMDPHNIIEPSQALDVLAIVFEPDEAQKIYQDLIQDEAFSYRATALRSFANKLKEKRSATDDLLDSILKSYDDPLFIDALLLRESTWSAEEKRRSLKKFYQDPVAPEKIREQSRELYCRAFPNAFIQIREDYSFDTMLIAVSIENISKESIQLEYSHLYDLITSQVELGYGGEQVPYRKDFKEVVDSERSELQKKELKPGEKLIFPSVNIWRYHDIPVSLPEQFAYRVISKLPQFGDVPAGVGSTGFFESKHEKKRKILLDAIEEQR